MSHELKTRAYNLDKPAASFWRKSKFTVRDQNDDERLCKHQLLSSKLAYSGATLVHINFEGFSGDLWYEVPGAEGGNVRPRR